MQAAWQVIESGPLSAEAVMDKDAFLLDQLKSNPSPLLHFYEWTGPALTYGYFIDPARYLDIDALKALGLQLARRPTGGGITFHLSDFAFSVLIPASHPRFSLDTLENYAFINRQVGRALYQFTQHALQPELLAQESLSFEQGCQAFCMAKPTRYDLVVGKRKVGGAAQRRTKYGLLHQATLSLFFPSIHLLRQILKNSAIILEAMHRHTYCLLADQATPQEVQRACMEMKASLKQFLTSL